MPDLKTWVTRMVAAACFCLPLMAAAQTPTSQPASANAASAQPGISIYSYEDDLGVVHFVDSLDLVPEPYRVQAAARAKAGAMVGDGQGNFNVVPVPAFPETGADSSLEVEEEGAGTAAGASKGTTSTNTTAGQGTTPTAPGVEAAPKLEGKAYWQARIAEWQQRKASAESELEQVEAQILRTRTLTPPGFQQTLVELQQKHEALEEAIKHAEDMLTNVIPEEARTAGVPPGWLR